MVRGKKVFKVREKSGNFTSIREKLILSRKLGKSEILRVHFYCFPSTFAVFKHFTDMNCVALVNYCLRQTDVPFSRTSLFFCTLC